MNANSFCHDESERRKWQTPEAILVDIGLTKGSVFIDIGCGQGFFALPAARIVGQSGMVYCLDISVETIGRLKERAAAEGLRNLTLSVGSAEEKVLCEHCGDFVFFAIVLHDFRDPMKVLLNAEKMLKPTGRIVDVDWKKEPMNLGPPLRIRFSTPQAMKLIEESGFKVETVKENGPFHYMITAKMQSAQAFRGVQFQ